jgi:ubiquinol-cytochrome c reductase cytochrome b subunit
LVPNPFFGGLLFPTVVFVVLYSWPWIEERLFTRADPSEHHLLDRPRDNPRRTGFATAFLTWIATVFFAGSADRLFLAFGVSYEIQVRVFRVLFFVAPIIAYIIARRVCLELRRRGDAHPLRGADAAVVRRDQSGRWSPGVAVDEPSSETTACVGRDFRPRPERRSL